MFKIPYRFMLPMGTPFILRLHIIKQPNKYSGVYLYAQIVHPETKQPYNIRATSPHRVTIDYAQYGAWYLTSFANEGRALRHIQNICAASQSELGTLAQIVYGEIDASKANLWPVEKLAPSRAKLRNFLPDLPERASMVSITYTPKGGRVNAWLLWADFPDGSSRRLKRYPSRGEAIQARDDLIAIHNLVRVYPPDIQEQIDE